MSRPTTIQYGVNTEAVFLKFDRPVPDLVLTPAQVDDMIEKLQKAKQASLDLKAGNQVPA